jgi:4-hydroxybenzoate polyprenyltransferase
MRQLVGAFFRLVRWPNLVFIFLTQLLFYYCIQLPLHGQDLFRIDSAPMARIYLEPVLKPRLFFLLAISSVLIAAAGYIINDYFDLNIDRVNKPNNPLALDTQRVGAAAQLLCELAAAESVSSAG